ncbi:MAG: class I SAM-dependent methyltransferase [Bdellovibrionales bacterium]|nr:class I SAM-dependent methyltransferase [Bdellovibrionales bacterium]
MEAHGREFIGCKNCDLVFQNPAQLPTLEFERQRYLEHENHIGNIGYTDFLGRLINALRPFLKHRQLGLDFGCGPSPVLATLLAREGYVVDCYDPFFFPYPTRPKYDFVTASEVCEHFHNPGREFGLICSLLGEDAHLGIMTAMLSNEVDFEQWYYARDETHVCFYSPSTFEVIAELFQLQILSLTHNVVVLKTRRSH